MSNTISGEMAENSCLKKVETTDFEALLGRAENLLQSSEVDAALDQLLYLQEKYVAATRLFDLIGEAYLRGLDYKQGVRYKTLYEVLTSTLSAQKLTKPSGGIPIEMVSAAESDVAEPEEPAAEPPSEPELPPICTSEMAHEFLRQGHYDKALAQFSKLLEENPDKDSLLKGRDTALKKLRERRLLGVLERWLENIEHMKSSRAKEHD